MKKWDKRFLMLHPQLLNCCGLLFHIVMFLHWIGVMKNWIIKMIVSISRFILKSCNFHVIMLLQFQSNNKKKSFSFQFLSLDFDSCTCSNFHFLGFCETVELKKQISCSLQLSNKSDNCVAFKVLLFFFLFLLSYHFLLNSYTLII